MTNYNHSFTINNFSKEKVNILRENYENLKGKISDYFEGKLVGEREGGDYFEGKLLIFI